MWIFRSKAEVAYFVHEVDEQLHVVDDLGDGEIDAGGDFGGESMWSELERGSRWFGPCTDEHVGCHIEGSAGQQRRLIA